MIITYDCRSDRAVLSGGSWLSTLPLAHLQEVGISKPARSNGLGVEATRLDIALMQPESFRTFLLGPGNFSPRYRYRITAYADAFVTPVHDSGWVQPHGGLNSLDLVWSDPGFWFGIRDERDPERGLWLIHVFDVAVRAQHWRLEIEDTGNPDGYVQAGRLFLGRSWEPSTGVALNGNGLSFQNAGLSSTALSGAQHAWRQINPRALAFGFDHLPQSEAFAEAYELSRIAGFDREVHVIPDLADRAHFHKRALFGRLTQMDPLALAHWRLAETGYTLEEIL